MKDQSYLTDVSESRKNPAPKKPREERAPSDEIVFIDEGNYVKKADAIFRRVRNLRLIGDTGVGKSTFVRYYCQKMKWPRFEYSLNAESTHWDLVAQDILSKGEIIIREGVILQWLKHKAGAGEKVVLFLDELNYAAPGVTSLLNQLTDFRLSIWIPELVDSAVLKEIAAHPENYPPGLLPNPEVPELKRSPDHLIVIGMNPSERSGYTGALMMNIAQLNRFESMELDYLSPNAEATLIEQAIPGIRHDWVKQLTTVAHYTRIDFRAGKLSIPLTTRNLMNYARLLHMENLTREDIGSLIEGMYPRDERKIIEQYWHTETGAGTLTRKTTGGLKKEEEEAS